jgi:hypothetical protein
MRVQHVDEIECHVESRDHGVCHREIQQKIIRNRPHPLVREDDPDHDQIPPGGHDDHARIQYAPKDLSPHRQDELIAICHKECFYYGTVDKKV